MTKYLEKQWQEMVESESDKYTITCYCAGFTCSGCEENTKKLIKTGLDIARSNLKHIPEVAELIEALEYVVKNSGTSTDYNLKARQALADWNKGNVGL